MGKSKLLHQRCHIAGFRSVCFQELTSCGCIIKQIPDKKCRSFRCAHILQGFFHTAIDHITYPAECRRCLRDQLHLCNCCNTGKCLPSKSQRRNGFQILYLFNFTGGMTQKCQGYLIFLHTPAIICNSYHLFTAVCDLHSHGSRTCVNGIFHELLHNRRRTLNHLTGSDLIDRLLV